jgi:hypothetical protein
MASNLEPETLNFKLPKVQTLQLGRILLSSIHPYIPFYVSKNMASFFLFINGC